MSSLNYQIVTSTVQLGAIARAARKKQGLTQLDVAGLAGKSNRFLIDLERGKETLQMQMVIDVLALLGLELVIKEKS
ncbi:y4mF family transcriptional regulator [Duganella sp. 3397]|uniref:helix-turn-helix domain-containing protein n=1 Tax=Duganella sp. 3397 TaxID=2817732 RepID=UPI002856EC3C|nr:helix-turn-helix domain-containing protein [Duganella sp. 3397]MDR7048320.1 y4mF family transcriptional regulator [Duganella sp. 3397]